MGIDPSNAGLGRSDHGLFLTALGVGLAALNQLPFGVPVLGWGGSAIALLGLGWQLRARGQHSWQPAGAPHPTNEEPVPLGSIEASDEDRYQLLDKLGQGQMGEVWRARHVRLGRECAIKIVRADRVSDDLVARFRREARSTAALLSPHTVRVHDFGQREDGSLFYVMELLSGEDLQSLVRRTGAMPPERVAHLLLQVCHALDEAHRAGLVHRDLKPENLVTCAHGLDQDWLKVVDFGLVKNTADTTEEKITSEGAVLGTAAYLAPESLKGSSLVDARADLYALGCIAHWLLTAQLVFVEDSVTRMVKAHLLTPPPRTRQLVPDLPEAFDQLIADCLQKSPDARPSSAAEVAERLHGLDLAPKWTRARAQKWWAASTREAR